MSTVDLQMKRGAMEHIDVHDLPEDQAKLVAAFVEFLRGLQQTTQDTSTQDQDWQRASVASFADDWDNEQDAVYDNWQQHYHV